MRKHLLVWALVLCCSFVYAQSTSAETALEEMVDELIGTPYKWAGTTTQGFDCSGFTTYVYQKLNVELPRTSASQAKEGTAVSKSDLRLGDLVFFNTNGKSISHVGIYLGDGKFVHSASNKGVMISDLGESYYTKRYVTARRVLSDDQYNQLIQEQEAAAEAAEGAEANDDPN